MKLLLLDRDGVINEDLGYLRSASKWRALPGSLEAIARLSQSGWFVTLVSNQSALGRKLLSLDELAEIQGKLQADSAATGAVIAGLSFCPHLPDAGCECRKPAPGMLLNIAKRLNVDLAEVPFIGDKLSDVLAAKAAGARPMLVLTGQGKDDVKSLGFPSDVPVYRDLAHAVDELLSAHQT